MIHVTFGIGSAASITVLTLASTVVPSRLLNNIIRLNRSKIQNRIAKTIPKHFYSVNRDISKMHAKFLSLFKKQSNVRYNSLAGDEKDTGSVSPIDCCEHTNAPKAVLPYVLPWVTSTIVFVWLAFYFFLRSLPAKSEGFGFKTGWSTDFGE